MHYDKERQEHNEKDWPDNDEWMEAVFQNGPTGEHYDLTVDNKEALNEANTVVK